MKKSGEGRVMVVGGVVVVVAVAVAVAAVVMMVMVSGEKKTEENHGKVFLCIKRTIDPARCVVSFSFPVEELKV